MSSRRPLLSALRLDAKRDSFNTPPAVAPQDCRFQCGIQLALLADGTENRDATFFEFAQVIQTLLQLAQLHIIERAGDLLAVTRNERNGGAAVEQRHRRLDLLLANAEFFGNL